MGLQGGYNCRVSEKSSIFGTHFSDVDSGTFALVSACS